MKGQLCFLTIKKNAIPVRLSSIESYKFIVTLVARQ